MGIRFNCHACNHAVHIKSNLAGRRGKCPACKISFRIPSDGGTVSLQVSANRVDPNRRADESPKKTAPQTTENRSTRPEVSSNDVSGSNSVDSPVLQSAKRPETDPNVQFYVRPPSGDTFGPADSNKLSQWADENRVTADTLVRRPIDDQWSRLDQEFPELFRPQEQINELSDSHDSTGSRRTDGPLPTIGAATVSPEGTIPPEVSSGAGDIENRRNKKSRALVWLVVLVVIAVSLFAILLVVLLSGFTLSGLGTGETS